jgi:Protein of unknown function (DUF3995)
MIAVSIVLVVLSLVVLAAAHSYLGERELIAPLLAQRPWRADPGTEPIMAGTMRVAWHLTSVAWLGLAGAVVLVPESAALLVATALVLLVSAALMHAGTRGWHGAWALFAVGGVAALWKVGIPWSVRASTGGVAALVLLAIGALHIGWAGGLRWGLSAAIPEVNGAPAFRPPPWATVAVAVALFTAAALVAARSGWLSLPLPSEWIRWLTLTGGVVFALRALGDFRTVGLTRRWSSSTFARWDALLFTPLCAALSTALLLVAAG